MTNVVIAFSLLLARVGTFVAILPVFGGQVPRTVKVALALVLTVFWFGALNGIVVDRAWLTHTTPVSWFAFGFVLIREAFLGALLGFVFSLFLAPAQIAGDYLTEEMGLSFGAQVDPSGGSTTGALTQLFLSLTMLLFLGLDAHHLFFAVFDNLLTRYPIGGPLPAWRAPQIVTGVAAVEEWGLVLAAPVGAFLFLTAVLLALMTRAAPQLNLYSVGFPLRLAAGLAGMLLFFPQLMQSLLAIFGRLSELLIRMV
jgi:flagellar biosynthetic protein FliR